MTWEFQATIADRVYRVIGPGGEDAWGIDNDDVDADSPEALGAAEVDLPTGRRTLLLVPASPGGFVLDAVRAYQGLTDAELSTLFLGIVTELRGCSRAEERLHLEAFALDAAGRPVLIPGIATPLATTPRRALGEMIYHAGAGRQWAESLLPVNVALADSSRALRALVGDLLTDTPGDSGLSAALTEVAEAMRSLAVPAPLPLVPADRDLVPEAALTARLRAASGRPVDRGRQKHSEINGSNGAGAPGAVDSARTDPVRQSTTTALRAASRGPRRSRDRPRRSEPRFGRWAADRFGSWPKRMRQLLRGRWLVAAALSLTVAGGFVIWTSWTATDAVQSTAAPTPQDKPRPENGPDDAADLSGEDVAQVLSQLCADRARALSDGDAAALGELTVPGSAAAAADELIDTDRYAGSDYSIEVDDVQVVDADENRVIASAQMHSSAVNGTTTREFESHPVEFVLVRSNGRWRVGQVAETTGRS